MCPSLTFRKYSLCTDMGILYFLGQWLSARVLVYHHASMR